MNRRQFLTAAAALLAAPKLAIANTNANKKFKFIHFTDLHLRDAESEGWLKIALKQIENRHKDAKFIVQGGDLVNGGRGLKMSDAQSLHTAWTSATKGLKIPLHHVMGNHDLIGVNEASNNKSHPLYGEGFLKSISKKDEFYYSFSEEGHKFIILNTVQNKPDNSYRGFVDEAQHAWLKREIASAGQTPTVVFMHIPMLTIMAQYDHGLDKLMPEWQCVMNGKEVRETLNKGNVLAVFQGHSHVVEDCFDSKTHYITGGAVCGAWWGGKRFDMYDPGYTVVTIENGQVDWKYESYGWKKA